MRQFFQANGLVDKVHILKIPASTAAHAAFSASQCHVYPVYPVRLFSSTNTSSCKHTFFVVLESHLGHATSLTT